MEDACWNCTSLDHHRRDCDQPTNPEAKKVVQKAYKNGSGKVERDERFGDFRQKFEKNLILSSLTSLPPVSLFSREVDRLHQMLHDIFQKMKSDIPSPIGSVSADILEQRVAMISHMQRSIEAEPSLLEIMPLKYAYNLKEAKPPTQDYILSMKINHLMEMKKDIIDKLFAAQNSLMAARKFVEGFNADKLHLNGFIERGIEIYSGRPLLIASVATEWDGNKTRLRNMTELARKFGYLFPDEDNDFFQHDLNVLCDAWNVLKDIKKNYEAEIPRINCKICCENEVQFALIPCGHTFCGQCIQNMDECGMCRVRINNFLRIYFS